MPEKLTVFRGEERKNGDGDPWTWLPTVSPISSDEQEPLILCLEQDEEMREGFF